MTTAAKILAVVDRVIAEHAPVGQWDVEDRRIVAVLNQLRAELEELVDQ